MESAATEIPLAERTSSRRVSRRRYNDLLRDNNLGIIDNPLIYRDFEDLRRDIQSFHKNHDLENVVDVEMLIRGARLAQDEGLFTSSEDLNIFEKKALEKEKKPKLFELSKELKVILLTCCIGAIVQGWSQANITGPNLHWPCQLNIPSEFRTNLTEYEYLCAETKYNQFCAQTRYKDVCSDFNFKEICDKSHVRDNRSECIENIKDTLRVPYNVIESAVGANCTTQELCLIQPHYGKYEPGKEVDPDDKIRIEKDGSRNLWLFGLVNAVSYFAASFVGAWLSDPLNEYFMGRRGALFVAAIFSLISPIGSAYANTWEVLLGWRFLQGVGMGAKAAVVPVFESEVSPPQMRGRLLVSWQTFTSIGIFLGSAANLIFHNNWRLQIGAGFIPAIPLLCLVFVCSESPRWLIKRKKYAEAYKVLYRLRDTPLQAARDLYSVHAQMQVETILFSKNSDVEEELHLWANAGDDATYQEEVDRTSYLKRFTQLFSIPRNRRATLAACIAMASQQFSGINIFAFLSASFFTTVLKGNHAITNEEKEGKNLQSLGLAVGFAAANAIFSPIAYPLIDKKGRRFLLLRSLLLMAPLLIGTAVSVQNLHENYTPSNTAAFAVCLILYTAVYSPGAGVVPFMYSSEVFPLVNREVGMSLSCAVLFALAGILALTVGRLINHPIELLGTFAALDAFAAFLVWLLLPGTAEIATLEEMNYIFGVSIPRHIQYQVLEVFPWVVKRWLPWVKQGDDPEPLYKWNKMRQRQPSRQDDLVAQQPK